MCGGEAGEAEGEDVPRAREVAALVNGFWRLLRGEPVVTDQ